jgi:hypothetical protein
VQASDQTEGIVSVVELKKLAKTKLPSSSAMRDLILSEPDYLSAEEVMIKVRVFPRLLYPELNNPNATPTGHGPASLDMPGPTCRSAMGRWKCYAVVPERIPGGNPAQ